MEFSCYLKKNFCDESLSSKEIYDESVINMLENKYLEEVLKSEMKNNKDIIKEVFQLLCSDKIRQIYIKGCSGTGKTYLLKTISNILNKKVLTYYYECVQATNLDDIILSLFNYLKKVTPKDTGYIRNFKISSSYSIDERLINRIKNLKKPLLVFIDGLENIFESEDLKIKKDLMSFLYFISSVSSIKIISSGKELPELENRKQVYTISLNGLCMEDALKLLKENKIELSEENARNFWEITKGYPENIQLFSSLINSYGLSVEETTEKLKNSKTVFDKVATEQLYNLIPENYRDLANFFILVRHSFSIDTLKKIDYTNNIEEKIKYLESIKLLNKNNEYYRIKQNFKKHLCKLISQEDKNKIHTWLHELYSVQIAAKLENRLMPVSRRLLYTEQFYHYKKLDESGMIEKYKSKTTRQQEAEAFFTKVEDESYENSDQIIKDHEEDNIDYQKENFYEFDDIYQEDGDFPKITLSEEEKSLLAEEDELKETKISQSSNEINESEIINETDFDSIEALEKKLFKSLENYKDDRLNYNYILFKLANLYKEHFRHEQALQNYCSVLNSDAAHLPLDILPEILGNIGEIFDYRKDFDTSINYFKKALIESEKQGNQLQKIKLYFKIALTYDDAGDYENALKFYQKNIEISENPAENPYIGAALSNTADIYDEVGNPVKAIEFYKKSLDFDSTTNNLEGMYEVLSKLGNIYFETGNKQEARKCFHKELNIGKEINDPYKIAMSYIDIGDVFLSETNYEKAVKAFILAKKSINITISTDSKEKIDRRFRQVIEKIGKKEYDALLKRIKSKKNE